MHRYQDLQETSWKSPSGIGGKHWMEMMAESPAKMTNQRQEKAKVYEGESVPSQHR